MTRLHSSESAGICVGIRTGMHVGICTGIHVGICVGMHMGICMRMCMGIRAGRSWQCVIIASVTRCLGVSGHSSDGDNASSGDSNARKSHC